jgi:methionyl-tRNA formyltransferase
LDEGPIIMQDVINVDHTYTAEDMMRAGRDVEKNVLSRALYRVLAQRVFVYGNRTVICNCSILAVPFVQGCTVKSKKTANEIIFCISILYTRASFDIMRPAYRCNVTGVSQARPVVGFPSGQREQTVNLPSQTSKVRILPPPPSSLCQERRRSKETG